jgi:hypothetical protein
MTITELIPKIIEYSTKYGPYIIATLTTYVNFIRKDLALVLSHADKDNDGTLTNPELEDLAIYYIRKSPNVFIQLIPESHLRALLKGLCGRRKLLVRVQASNDYINELHSNNDSEEGD